MASKSWTPDEDAFLADNYLDMTHKDIGRVIGRSHNAVRGRCHILKLRKKVAPWTKEEENRVFDVYRAAGEGHVDLPALSKELGRSRVSVCMKARKLGLTDTGRPHSDASHKAIGEKVREWQKKHGHPRGALGMRHSDEAKAKMSKAGIKRHAEMPPEESARQKRKMVETKLKKYGVASTGNRGKNPYSRTKSGKREDLDGQFFRSSWEANYARYLNVLIGRGEILRWEFEPDTFRFEDVKRGPYTYTPDFKVFTDEGYTYHEVKGWMDGPSKSRLKRFAKHYPDEELVLIDANVYRVLNKEHRDTIPHWEGR